jgi:hypothetical protein
MKTSVWKESVIGMAMALAIGFASPAEAQFVTFSDIYDAVPAKFFDPDTSAPDAANPNRLIIGLHTGRDWTVWKDTNFRASTAAYSYTTAMDTLSFRVDAPSGFYVSKITYSQTGSGSVVRTGKAAGATTWVVAGRPADLGTFGTNPTQFATIDLTGQNLTSVPVSISNSLFAFSTPSLGSAAVSLTSAEVVVELSPVAP